MSKFKVGDKVVVTKRAGSGNVGDKLTVSGVGRYGTESYEFKECGFWFRGENLKLVWQPQPGEMIAVSDKHLTAKNTGEKREFVAMDGDVYVCRAGMILTKYLPWKYAEQIPTTHTIAIDGKTAEISAESMAALKELLL